MRRTTLLIFALCGALLGCGCRGLDRTPGGELCLPPDDLALTEPTASEAEDRAEQAAPASPQDSWEAEAARGGATTPLPASAPGDAAAGEGGEGSGAAPAEVLARIEPGRRHPLLIYSAELRLGVYEPEAAAEAASSIARGLGGFLAYRGDHALTLRVPAGRFQMALERIEDLGEVLGRSVRSLDVTEEFRDLTARLRNAEAVRAQLVRLLERARDVKAALAVQAELAKVTETIERLKGRLRFLEDRIAYSTITVRFRPRAQPPIDSPTTFRLPFLWLDNVGLRTLLQLR